MYLNRVELIGFVGSDPEAKFTPNGKSVTSLSLATKTSWKTGDERKQRTEWHKVRAWGKLAEYAATFKKGAHIRIEGELRSREYQNNAGVTVRTFEIVADTIINLRAGQRTVDNSDAGPAPEPEAHAEPAPAPAPAEPAEPAPAATPAPKKSRKRSRKAPEEARS